jgi:hypothetical protein
MNSPLLIELPERCAARSDLIGSDEAMHHGSNSPHKNGPADLDLAVRPGCLVLDVGVPSDIRRVSPARDDVLVLSASYTRVPVSMPRDSFFLRFFHGIVPSCLGETMVLALENRAFSFSIGRQLDLARVREIGRLAESHGFSFSEPLASGLPLCPEARSQFLKVRSKTRPAQSPRAEMCTLRRVGAHQRVRRDNPQ